MGGWLLFCIQFMIIDLGAGQDLVWFVVGCEQILYLKYFSVDEFQYDYCGQIKHEVSSNKDHKNNIINPLPVVMVSCSALPKLM